jgi:uncharacterized membrane protein
MRPKAKSSLRIVRVARGHARLWISATLGVATFAGGTALVGNSGLIARLLMAWDVGVACYLIATAVMMGRSTTAEIRKHSAAHDEGAAAILVLTVAAAVASLGAVFAGLAGGGNLNTALAVATVVLSWTFIHTIFALHYAYEFYGDDDSANGLDFPGDDKPDYWDFIYFAFVLGSTFQVSDVAVTNKWIRRVVVTHGVLAFFFNAAVVALTVNLAANAMQK